MDNMISKLTLDNDLPPRYPKSWRRLSPEPQANWVQRNGPEGTPGAVEAVSRFASGGEQFIVREGDIVTEDQMAILVELGMVGSPLRFSAVAGALLMSVLVLGVLWGYLRIHHPDVFKSDKIAVLASVLIVSVVVIQGVAAFSGFLIPVATGVLLASTLFDRRFGALFAAVLTMVTGTVTGFDVRYMALSLAGGLMASLAIGSEWNRMHLIRAGFMVTFANIGTYIGLGLTGTVPLDDILSWRDMLMVVLSGPVSAVLAVGLLPLFEAAFGIITPIKLLELSNPEHPLLHRLLLGSRHLPPQHNGSQFGRGCRYSIGADSLLARLALTITM